MRFGWVKFGVMAAVAVLMGTPASAATVSEEARCTIVKLKSSVKEVKDKAQCYERSLKADVPVSGACLKRAEDKRERLFERAEQRGGCKTTKEGATIGVRVDAFLQDINRTLDGSASASAKASGSPPKEDAKAAEGTKKAEAPAATPVADSKEAAEAKKPAGN
jgi:hypothetical protein